MLMQVPAQFRVVAPPSVVFAGKFPETLKKSPPCVLVVDDEPLVRWSIAEMLGAAGYDILEAGDAEGALQTLLQRSRRPDAVLLDLRLPDCHDLWLLRALRGLAPRATLVLMTAFGTPEIAAQARNMGADAVLNKPFDLETLDPLLASAAR
jgi:DNA-binding NtrC family response regulator